MSDASRILAAILLIVVPTVESHITAANPRRTGRAGHRPPRKGPDDE
jgi:hypothetical protein